MALCPSCRSANNNENQESEGIEYTCVICGHVWFIEDDDDNDET